MSFEQPVEGMSDADAKLYADRPFKGVQEAARVDQSDYHIAAAALDPELQRLMDRAGELAVKSTELPSYANKEAYHNAEQAVRDYAGPLGASQQPSN